MSASVNIHQSARLGALIALALACGGVVAFSSAIGEEQTVRPDLQQRLGEAFPDGKVELGPGLSMTYDQACLMSEPYGSQEVGRSGCFASGDVLVLRKRDDGTCVVVDLEAVPGMVLTGSAGEWDCRAVSDDLSLELRTNPGSGNTRLFFSR